jgi:DNA-binding MarR family transcriptional regulator
VPRTESSTSIDADVTGLLLRWMSLTMGATSKELLEQLHDSGITVAQMMALHVLHSERTATLTALAERLQLSLSATSTLVQKLVDVGLVTRTEHNTDRRNKVIALSGHGSARLHTFQKLRGAGIHSVLRSLSSDTKSFLFEALHAVLRDVELAPESSQQKRTRKSQ